MTDPWHMLGPQGKSDRPVWLFAAGVAFVLLALAIGSALSYTSIVVAQATVSISPSTSLTLQGTNSESFRSGAEHHGLLGFRLRECDSRSMDSLASSPPGH